MMAPESERAKMKHSPDCNLKSLTTCACGALQRHLEPTLTCSEVVDRLANDLADVLDALIAKHGIEQLPYEFYEAYRAKVRLILHSWRERRVQELPILEKFEDEIALHGGFGLTIDQLENLRAALVSAIGKANYPRREQNQEGREA